MNQIETIAHYGPVTALEFAGDLLLVGQGPRVKIYEWKTGSLIKSIKLFKRDKIHGIRVQGDNVAIWGGRSVAALKSDGSILFSSRHVNDWVCSVAFAQSESNEFLYVQTAHNAIYCLDNTSKVIKIVTCAENSVLYSGSILALPNGDALIGAGTVLDGAVIWRLSDQQILHRYNTHEGSIFGVVFSSDGKRLITCSDDRSIRLWDNELGEEIAVGWGHMGRIWEMRFAGDKIISISEDLSARLWSVKHEKLECERIFEGHLGRNAWCGAVHESEDLLVTGGGDGRVIIWDLRLHQIDQNPESVVAADYRAVQDLGAGEIKDFALLEDLTLAVTKSKLLIRDKNARWRGVDGVKVDAYTQLITWPELAVVCCGDGTVTELQVTSDQVTVLKTHEVKLKGRLNYIFGFQHANQGYFYVAASQNPHDKFQVFKFGENTPTEPQILDRPADFQPSSAFCTPEGVLYIGSRHGSLVSYDFAAISAAADSLPIRSLHHTLMSQDTVTSIFQDGNVIYLTSRGGEYCAVTDTPDGLETVAMNNLAKGAIMGGKVVSGDLLLYGFRNEQFFIWDDTTQCELANEKCGGMHRNWDVKFDSKCSRKFVFAYIKAGQLFFKRQLIEPRYNTMVLQQGTHGREIRALEFSPRPLSDGSRALATASEDTCVRFSVLSENGNLRTHVTQRKHVAGMQSVHWSPDGQYLLSSAANEELFIWKVSDLSGKLFSKFHSRLPTSKPIPDLRIMDFSMSQYYGGYLLATIYSDSTIKLWKTDTDFQNFELLKTRVYMSCCLLNCEFVGGSDYLVVSATNGRVFALKTADTTELLFDTLIHQSSVKAVAIIDGTEGEKYYISGGDDNALALSKFTLPSSPLVTRYIVEGAHIATITSIVKLHNGFMSISVDQEVKRWIIKGDQLRLVDSTFTTVADTGVADSIVEENRTTLSIAGSGLSIWQC